MRKLIATIILLMTMTSCIDYWIFKNKGAKQYEIPPITQVFYQVDTLYLDNPVVIREKGNAWLVDAKDSVFTDELAESYLTDSVRYVWGKLYDWVAIAFNQAQYEKMFRYNNICYCKQELMENDMKKYQVYTFVDRPYAFILCLINTAYYMDRVQSIDNPIWFTDILKDKTITYLPVVYPVGCCDYSDQYKSEFENHYNNSKYNKHAFDYLDQKGEFLVERIGKENEWDIVYAVRDSTVYKILVNLKNTNAEALYSKYPTIECGKKYYFDLLSYTKIMALRHSFLLSWYKGDILLLDKKAKWEFNENESPDLYITPNLYGLHYLPDSVKLKIPDEKGRIFVN